MLQLYHGKGMNECMISVITVHDSEAKPKTSDNN